MSLEINSAVVASLTAVVATCLENNLSDGSWTNEIKASLDALGRELGYKTCASGSGGKYGAEWLYDLVWFKVRANEHLKEIGLIMESEWLMDFDEIRYDFEKLLIADCSNKVMIFQTKDNTEYLGTLNKLIKNTNDYQTHTTRDQVYLFACYVWECQKFEFKTCLKKSDNTLGKFS